MGCEDNIARTTVYISKMNKHRVEQEKKTNKHFSLSSFLEEQLTQYFYGDEYELQTQLKQLDKRLDEINRENQAILSRKTELQEKIENHDKQQIHEKTLYKKFISNVTGRIRNIEQYNMAPEYTKICNHFHHRFFPENNIDIKVVKQILHSVKTDKMDFEMFQSIRRGEFNKN